MFIVHFWAERSSRGQVDTHGTSVCDFYRWRLWTPLSLLFPPLYPFPMEPTVLLNQPIRSSRYNDNSTAWESIKISFSSVQLLSRVQLFATPWSAACQASQSITNSQSQFSSAKKTTVYFYYMPRSELSTKWAFTQYWLNGWMNEWANKWKLGLWLRLRWMRHNLVFKEQASFSCWTCTHTKLNILKNKFFIILLK